MANYLTYPTAYLNLAQTYTSNYTHSSHITGDIVDYPIDEACEDDGRSWFRCPCDEIRVAQIYGVGNSGVNTIWLESTTKVVMPYGTAYVTILVTHPNDETLSRLHVGDVFHRDENMFVEGDDGKEKGLATGNHFHISVGTGKLSGNGWAKNSNGAWCLTTTGVTIKPQHAFYVDKRITRIVDTMGLTFKEIPSYATVGDKEPEEPQPTNIDISAPINALIAKYNNAIVWESGKQYAAGDRVVYRYDLYICLTAHTSGEEFDDTKWSRASDEQYGTDQPYDATDEIEDLKDVIRGGIAVCDEALDDGVDGREPLRQAVERLTAETDAIKARMDSISDSLTPSEYFGADFEELSHYIFEGVYKDDFVVITDEMSNADRFSQYRSLYARAKAALKKASSPKRDFQIDTQSFVFADRFAHMTRQLVTGCIVHADVIGMDGFYEDLFLNGITVNYDDKSVSLSFGEEYTRGDIKALYDDIMGRIDKSSNSIGYLTETINAVKAGHIKELEDAEELSRALSLQNGLSTDDGTVTFNAAGLVLKTDSNGVRARVVVNSDGISVIGNKNNFTAPVDGKTRADGFEASAILADDAKIGDLTVGTLHIDGTYDVSAVTYKGAPVAALSSPAVSGTRIDLNLLITPGIYIHKVGTQIDNPPSINCSGGTITIYDSAGSYWKGDPPAYDASDARSVHIIQEYRTYNNAGVYKRYGYSDSTGSFFFNPWKYTEI